MNSEIEMFLREMQGHPLWPELMKQIPEPSLPRFRASDTKDPEKARAEWIYRSGEIQSHERWKNLLLGDVE